MSIWFQAITPEQVEENSFSGLTETLGIRITDITEDGLFGKMPVTTKHLQPHGILHGGATIALGETLASIAAFLTLDPVLQRCVGQHVEANHIRPASSGWVYGHAKLRHRGRRQQLWDIEITNDEQKLISIQRIGMAIIKVN